LCEPCNIYFPTEASLFTHKGQKHFPKKTSSEAKVNNIAAVLLVLTYFFFIFTTKIRFIIFKSSWNHLILRKKIPVFLGFYCWFGKTKYYKFLKSIITYKQDCKNVITFQQIREIVKAANTVQKPF
jgi:hypothetical protein